MLMQRPHDHGLDRVELWAGIGEHLPSTAGQNQQGQGTPARAYAASPTLTAVQHGSNPGSTMIRSLFSGGRPGTSNT